MFGREGKLNTNRGIDVDVIFVSGIMRSGTTLLQRVLANSLKIDTIPEFTPLNVIINSFKTLDQYKTFQHLSRDEFLGLYQNFISDIILKYANNVAKERVIFKDPLAIQSIESFVELMPNIKFVLSVRNPMATIASIYRVRNKQLEKAENTFISAMDFEGIVNYVKQGCDMIIRLFNSDNIFLAKYEEIVNNSEHTRKRLSNFTECEISFSLPDNSSAFDKNDAFWTPETGAAVTSTSLGKFQTELSMEQKIYIQNKFGHFMRTFSYPTI